MSAERRRRAGAERWARTLCGLLILAALVSLGCRSRLPRAASPSPFASAAGSSEGERWNVLLLTIDCLRPDHLSLYGYARDTSPHLDAFAREAWVFENAFATSAWTSPSIVSMLTGLYPPVHGQNGRHSFWDPELSSALRTLVASGYRSFGRSASGPNYGGLGFQEEVGDVDFAEFVRARAAEPEGAPFFAWLHSKEPHLPYQPSATHAGRYTGRLSSTPGIEAVRRHALILRQPPPRLRYEHAGRVRFTEADVAPIRALYDETLRDADDRLGRAFAALRETGRQDRTIVVVSADHGEELFEHGWVGHASTGYDGKLSDELVRIPLVIRLPGGSAGRSAALVQSVDLMPSLFAWLGIEATGLVPQMQGHSLAALIEGRATAIREQVFLQTTRKGWTTPREEMPERVTAVRSRDRKLVWWPAEGERPARMSAFDLVADPEERIDLYARDPSRFRDLERARAAWDAENLRATAELLMPAARQHLEGEARALARGDLLAALHAWRRFYLLHRTWGFEEHPFQADPRLGPPWHALRRRAGHALTAAIDCDLEGKGRGCLAAAGAGLRPRAGAGP